MSEDPDTESVFALLEDEYARAILIETSDDAMSANTLSERCDASLATVYRRLERLEECGLVDGYLRPQPDGNHHKMYAARLESVQVEFADGEMRVEMERAEPTEPDAADRFTRMWTDL